VSLDVAKAQLMCRKPSSFGLIYPRFDALTHVVKAHVIAELITGEPHPPDLSKAQLVQILIQNGAAFFGGIDHGFSHNFASSVGAKWGNRGFIIDSLSVPELELADKIEAIRAQEKRLGGVRPTYYADPEDPAANKTLGRHFKIAKWEKGPGSVQEGIDIVRMKLAPPFGAEPDLYFLDDDEGVDFLCKQLQIHHWKIDAAGNPTNVPDEEGKDECDSVRYGVMNVFKKGKLSLAGGTAKPTLVVEKQYTEDNWMQAKIAELTQGANNATTVTVRKGNFIFDG
jgi:hypothetical protein